MCQTLRHFALGDSVSSLHSPIHSPLRASTGALNGIGPSTWPSQECTLCTEHSHLPGRQKGPQGFLSAWTPAGSALAGNDSSSALLRELVQNGARLGVKPDPKASTAAPSVSSQPWSGPLAFCCSCWAPVGFVPLFLKPQGEFCFLSWGRMTTIITSSITPVNPWRYSLGQSPPLPHPFWAVVSSPLITVFSLLPLVILETKLFPRNSFFVFFSFIVYL